MSAPGQRRPRTSRAPRPAAPDSPSAPSGEDPSGEGPDAGIASRTVAVDLLRAVLRERRTLDEALGDHPGFAALAPRDRAHVHLGVATALRRLGQIDALLDAYIARPLPDRAEVVRDILRLALAHLLFLETPPHAAVDTAVVQVGRRGHAGLKGLANAVLRRAAVEGRAAVAAQDAGRLNTPAWLFDSWVAAFGTTAAAAIADAHLREAPLDLTPKDPAAAAHWAAELGAEVLPTGTLRRPAGGAVADLPGFTAGAWWVQDAAAALPARLLGRVAGRRVIDLAAAPGGKTAQLAAAGAAVTAVDRAPARMRRLHENLARLGLIAETVVADAAAWRPDAPADAVLLDAPCTATGTIRRHPDVARVKAPADVARLAAVQDRLLAAAVEMAGPGCVIVYACCSLQPEEGPERIAALLAADARVARDPVRGEEVAGLSELLTADGDLRTLPSHLADRGGMDGFFAARLRRV